MSKQELRSALLGAACALNQDNCIKKARAAFQQYVKSNGTARYVKHTGNAHLLIFSFIEAGIAKPMLFILCAVLKDTGRLTASCVLRGCPVG